MVPVIVHRNLLPARFSFFFLVFNHARFLSEKFFLDTTMHVTPLLIEYRIETEKVNILFSDINFEVLSVLGKLYK